MIIGPYRFNDRGNTIGIFNALDSSFTPVKWQGSIEATCEKAKAEVDRLNAEYRKENA